MAGKASQQTTIVVRVVYQMFMTAFTGLTLVIAVVYYLLPLPETVDQVLTPR